jgi:FAD/FMN-containing dehydrogenase
MGNDTVTRRSVLAAAGAVMIGGVAACDDDRPVAASGTGGEGGGAAAATPAGIDYAALRRALTGSLLRPGDAGYAAAATPFNAALGRRRPAAIATVASTADVATCVRRAGGRGVPLAARSGGHSYAGYSTPDGGVVVDLSALRSVTVAADGTATVGAGARLIDVYAGLAAHGRAIPAGSCGSVGIGGSTLGGGIGVVARAYGLTCDHLRAATVVLADGSTVTAGPGSDADLFWALRGGGGGNGGIVTSFTFATVPAPAVTTFRLVFPPAATAAVLHAWSSWMDAAPDRLTALCAVTAGATPANRISGTWTGPVAGLATQLSALIAAAGVAPSRRTQHSYDYLTAMRAFAGCLDEPVTSCRTAAPEPFRAASRMLDRPLTAGTAARVVNLVSRQRGMTLLFDSLRGAVGRVGAAETAFAHRSSFASVQVYSGRAAADPAVLAVQAELAPLTGTGAYVNYLNPGQKDWATAYYGGNLARLRRVIGHYDPDAVFGFPQSLRRA